MKILLPIALLLMTAAVATRTATAATFGTVVPIGGHAADIALDEQRGRLYVANFTANRIEVISTANNTRLNPIPVAPQPGTLALSPDGRYLVIGHYARWDPPSPAMPSVTILDLSAGSKREIQRPFSPLAIAFGAGSQALIAYGPQPVRPEDAGPAPFELLDPVSGSFTQIAATIVDSKNIPVPFATFPPEILKASAGVSGDGQVVYMLLRTQDTEGEKDLFVRYRVGDPNLLVGIGESSPDLGPRVVSVDRDGSHVLFGWALDRFGVALMAQFPYPSGRFNVGSHAFDFSRNLIYGHIPTDAEAAGSPSTLPIGDGAVLTIFDSDNLTVRERLRIPESLAGKSLLNSNQQTLYAVSDSGVTIIPIGSLNQTHRIATLQEDLLFESDSSGSGPLSRELDIVNPGGGNTEFRLSVSALGVRIIPDSGVTPARVRVEVDPAQFLSQRGTTAVPVRVESSAAINIPFPVRVLVNTRESDQRGTIVNVPGKLVDILADPVRNRFYVLRQDKNLVLVFDGASLQQVASLRTGNTPMQTATTRDGKFLLVGNDNSQIANVFDLDTLQPSQFITFPGHYPHSIAVSNSAILATVRSAFPTFEPPEYSRTIIHVIDEIDFAARTSRTPRSLGIYENEVLPDAVLGASPTRESVLLAMSNGTLALYEAASNTWVASRKDFESLSGAYAAITDRLFVAENHIVNWSLVPASELETASGTPSGLTTADPFGGSIGVRTTSPGAADPGTIQRVDLTTLLSGLPVRMAESPLLSNSLQTPPIGQIGQTILPFLRTLVHLPSSNSLVSLTTSVFTVLPRDFDAGTGGPAPGVLPVVSRVVNLADGAAGVAPGGLITILGSDFSIATENAAGLPLSTRLAGTSVSANNRPVPLLMVSPNRIEAQLPFDVVGSLTLLVRTGAGISAPFVFTALPGAPAIFRTGTAGPLTGLATVYRAVNNEPLTLTNPVHPQDMLTIFVTGLGVTAPAVASGAASPGDPLTAAILTPQVTIGGTGLPILFAGLTPELVGVYQINVLVPDGVPEGMDVPLTIWQGSYTTTLSVRVVR